MAKLRWFSFLLLLLPVSLTAQAADSVPVLALSGQAQRYLRLQYEAYGNREFLACLMGKVEHDTAHVVRVVPADVEPAASTPTTVSWTTPCEHDWPSIIGMVHNHPGGVLCSHRLVVNGTVTGVWTYDMNTFHSNPQWSLSVIVCGDSLVWIDRQYQERTGHWPH